MPAPRSATHAGSKRRRDWSAAVTRKSDALDLEPGVFKRSPAAMARSLARSAEASTRRKASPFRSAMSMLVFFQNRAGRALGAERMAALEKAKDELRKLYGRATSKANQPTREAAASRRKRRKPS